MTSTTRTFARRPALWAFAAALLALGAGALRAQAADESGDDALVGALDEGKTYRKVDGQPITGAQIGDILANKIWDSSIEDLISEIAVEYAEKEQNVRVTEEEIDAELTPIAQKYAKAQHMDPNAVTLEAMARGLGVALKFMRRSTKGVLVLRKILTREGKLKPGEDVDGPLARELMKQKLEYYMGKNGGVMRSPDAKDGVILKVHGREFNRAYIRKYALERMGPLTKSELLNALELLTQEALVQAALKAKDKEEIDYNDRRVHLTYESKLQEFEQGVPSGMQVLDFQLAQQGMTRDAYVKDRIFTFNAGITWLARNSIGDEKAANAEIRNEFNAHPDTYRRNEKRIAHLFLRVLDPEGRPYARAWKAEGHPKVNEFVAKQREQQFAAAKNTALQWEGLARAQFPEAVKKFSQDERSKAEGGDLGFVGPKVKLPPPCDDPEWMEQVMKLELGEIKLLRSAYGWHWVYCLRKEEQKVDIEKDPNVREHVYVMLLKRERKKVYDALQAKAKIENFF